MTGYAWKPGKRFNVSASVVGEAVDRLIAENGICDPAALVALAEAEPADAPLRKAFQWDDEEAGKEYRIEQARHLIASVRITVLKQPTDDPAFVSVRFQPDDQPGYLQLHTVRADEQMRAATVAREFAQLIGWVRRTRWAAEFAPVRAAVLEVEAMLAGSDDLSIAAD